MKTVKKTGCIDLYLGGNRFFLPYRFGGLGERGSMVLLHVNNPPFFTTPYVTCVIHQTIHLVKLHYVMYYTLVFRVSNLNKYCIWNNWSSLPNNLGILWIFSSRRSPNFHWCRVLLGGRRQRGVGRAPPWAAASFICFSSCRLNLRKMMDPEMTRNAHEWYISYVVDLFAAYIVTSNSHDQ